MKLPAFILLSLLPGFMSAQSLTLQDSTLFDFWVGDWDLTWTTAEGKIEKGSNHIAKILDGKVIQENFSFASGKFKGTSISVYNPGTKKWHQAWADTQGGYFDLEGDMDGHKRIFKTKAREQNGHKIIQRMVFHSIQQNSLTWDWEVSRDGGLTWQLQWRINYQRKNS
jgi:hypothetical protein